VPAKLTGDERLFRALDRVVEEATDKSVHLAAAEIVLHAAAPKSPSSRGARTGRTAARKTGGVVRFGGPRTPWVPPSHFGHGSPANPRPQGGYMTPTPFLWDALDARSAAVTDLYYQRLDAAIRRNGLK
jgi:hypothetical protein